MKIAVEPFLLDNALMNVCVYRLTAAWMGVRIRALPTTLVSLLGAVYALLSLFVVPVLREPFLKLPCFLLLSLPLYRRAGAMLRAAPYLLLSAALVGGTAMLLTLAFGGTVYADGTMVGTVPVRAALLAAAAALCLPRTVTGLLAARRKRSLHTEIEVQLLTHTYRLDALIDSGNLLKDPVSGLPVILLDRPVDRPAQPIPFHRLSGEGMLYGERPKRVILPEYGNAAVDCIAAEAPEPIGTAQAILPEILLPYEWRSTYDRMVTPYVGSPARAASHWQTQYLMVRSHGRRPAAAARSAGRGGLHRTCGRGQGRKG